MQATFKSEVQRGLNFYKYDFYEVVKTESNLDKHKEINGLNGIVLALGLNKDENFGYSICVLYDMNDLSNSDGWDIDKKYLQPTETESSSDGNNAFSAAETIAHELFNGHQSESF